jgi:hypothetical protein
LRRTLDPEPTMKTWIRRLLERKHSPGHTWKCRSFQPSIEALDERIVPTVTNPYGGPVVAHVEAQALYLGSDWGSGDLYQQTGVFDAFVKSIVNSSYMDMLTNAGYGVGRGTADTGRLDLVRIDKTHDLTQGAIEAEIQRDIKSGLLKSPDASRLYMVYVEPDVAVMTRGGGVSGKNFDGYHTYFYGTTYRGQSTLIHYALMPYLSGVNGVGMTSLGTVDSMTLTSSHELAESVTDPNINAWYDRNGTLDEVGDITAWQAVYLNGHAVQRIADKNDQAMTPAGATGFRQASFALTSSGELWEYAGGTSYDLSGGIASISDQSIDNYGRAMIDVVTTDGEAFEYHDVDGWTDIAAGVKQAVAGQGVSYILQTSGDIWEYRDYADARGKNWTHIFNGGSQISAGTDRFGVNKVDIILTSGAAWEHSDSRGWTKLGASVQQISAGLEGFTEFVTTSGNLDEFNQWSNKITQIASGVAQVAAGYDPNGGHMVELLYTSGQAYEYRGGSWTFLDSGVQSLSKARAGLIDVVFSDGSAYEHSSGGWYRLASDSVVEAA